MVTRQIVRVVLASPGDVQEERERVASVVEEVNTLIAHHAGLDLELGRWETDAFPGFHVDGPQGLIDEVLRIEDSSIVIGIFWKRFGTPVPDAGSGTEHEILRAYESWKSKKRPEIMLYFKTAAFYPESQRDLDQMRSVMEFRERFKNEAVYFSFETPDEFERQLRHQLTAVVRRLAIPGVESTAVDQVESALARVQSVVPRDDAPPSVDTPSNSGEQQGAEHGGRGSVEPMTRMIFPSGPARIHSPFPRYLQHDNVLWEDEGRTDIMMDRAIVEGPLCPTDRATLRIRRGRLRDTKVVGDDDAVGKHFVLTCPECQSNYHLTPDASDRKVRLSRDEVRARFEGLRRHDQQA